MASPASSSHDLYSEEAGTPLLGRATQGQFAPGSTWKPIMATGALENGFAQDTQLACSSGLQVGNRWFKNYESASYGYIGFDQALQLSCDTFFYRVGLHFWQRYGSDPTDVDAKDPLVGRPSASGSAAAPASTCRGRQPAGSRTGSGSWPTDERCAATTAAWTSAAPAPKNKHCRRSCGSLRTSSASRAATTAPVTR